MLRGILFQAFNSERTHDNLNLPGLNNPNAKKLACFLAHCNKSPESLSQREEKKGKKKMKMIGKIELPKEVFLKALKTD